MKKRIAHIVPSMNIGGVEIAVRRSHAAINEEFDYRVFYIRQKGLLQCGQEPVWKLLQHWIRGDWRPDVVITSLWWSHPFGWLLKTVGSKWVAFFHSSAYEHVVDQFLLKRSWKNADYCLVDSNATKAFLECGFRRSALLVPYVFPVNGVSNSWESRSNDLIWIGRPTSIKRIDLLVEFLGYVQLYLPQWKSLIAIAGDVPSNLIKFSNASSLKIDIRTNVPHSELLQELGCAKFYFLFSDHEGMSMGTIEAVQAGCVPVVRPVGEIPNYLSESACLRIPDDSSETLEALAKSLAEISQNRFFIEEIKAKALSSVNSISFYPDALRSAMRQIIAT